MPRTAADALIIFFKFSSVCKIELQQVMFGRSTNSNYEPKDKS